MIDTTTAAVGAFFGAIGSRLAYDELKAWSPRLVDRLVKRAVMKLPESQRERMAEEWASHVDDTPGMVGKLWTAIGFGRAARVLNRRRLPWWRAIQIAFTPNQLTEMTFVFGILLEVVETIPDGFSGVSKENICDTVVNNWSFYDTCITRVRIVIYPFIGNVGFIREKSNNIVMRMIKVIWSNAKPHRDFC